MATVTGAGMGGERGGLVLSRMMMMMNVMIMMITRMIKMTKMVMVIIIILTVIVMIMIIRAANALPEPMAGPMPHFLFI